MAIKRPIAATTQQTNRIETSLIMRIHLLLATGLLSSLGAVVAANAQMPAVPAPAPAPPNWQQPAFMAQTAPPVDPLREIEELRQRLERCEAELRAQQAAGGVQQPSATPTAFNTMLQPTPPQLMNPGMLPAPPAPTPENVVPGVPVPVLSNPTFADWRKGDLGQRAIRKPKPSPSQIGRHRTQSHGVSASCD